MNELRELLSGASTGFLVLLGVAVFIIAVSWISGFVSAFKQIASNVKRFRTRRSDPPSYIASQLAGPITDDDGFLAEASDGLELGRFGPQIMKRVAFALVALGFIGYQLVVLLTNGAPLWIIAIMSLALLLFAVRLITGTLVDVDGLKRRG